MFRWDTGCFGKPVRSGRPCVLTLLIRCALTLIFFIPAIATAASALSDARLIEQVIRIPVTSAGSVVELETTLFKPPGDGPFPVLIMNHGKARGSPRQQERDRFVAVSREFVKRGYAVVVPMRKGFARSSGQYADDGCNLTVNGQNQANDVQGVVE